MTKFSIRRIDRLAAIVFFVLMALGGAPLLSAQVTVRQDLPISAGYGAPEWLVKAAAADDFEDSQTLPFPSQPYAAHLQSSQRDLAAVESHQPAGALTGKVVFLMAGHGWTYDETRQIYYTQRGLSHGVVEDLGNADQMHIFAHLLWNAGATVAPLRPVDQQSEERIVDNTSRQGSFYGPWAASASPVYFGEGGGPPYLVATASLQETAVARYQPWIPVGGIYPVYAWARDGKDRVNQLYRIIHAGGSTQVRVNHQRVGKGWIWLGSFRFNAGDKGSVEISNAVTDPYEADGRHVVIADAIRFGNGRGDVPRPGGISGMPRADEGDCYWIERSLGPTADRRIYTGNKDGNATIASPPRTAAYMNREADGGFLDRVLISFHSNASSGKARGAVALFNANPAQRPEYQEQLAELMGSSVNQQMLVNKPLESLAWINRERATYNGINFGELRKDYVQNEMSATIVETGFHDNAEDARFLLNPLARIGMAQATLRGLLKWKSQVEAPQSAIAMLPSAPESPAVKSLPEGKLEITWKPGPSGALVGDPATEFRVSFSTDSLNFDAGRLTGGKTNYLHQQPAHGPPVYVRITALNPGGESFPSSVIAASSPFPSKSRSQGQRVLLVGGGLFLDASLNDPQALGNHIGSPYPAAAATSRVRPIPAMAAVFGKAEADALTSVGRHFDGCAAQALEGGNVRVKDYALIVYCAGSQNPESAVITSATQRILRDYMGGGGSLLISGSQIAKNLSADAGANRRFLQTFLGVDYVGEAQVPAALVSASGRFLETDLRLAVERPSLPGSGAGSGGNTLAVRGGKSIPVLKYEGSNSAAGVLSKPTASPGEIIYLAFPFEAVSSPADRGALMQACLKQLL